MGWFGSSTPAAPKAAPSDVSLVEGGFHASEAAQNVPVKFSATTGSGASGEAAAAGTPPQYDFNQTIASTYFAQGDDKSRALIHSSSNQIHRWAAYLFGIGAYSFGSAMHVFGQGTALTTLTMSAAGTCFFLNAQNRNVNGPTKDIFWFECLGSWLWVMASFQQFSTIKKMKYAGYSSWSGLALTVYYSTRYLVALQKEEN